MKRIILTVGPSFLRHNIIKKVHDPKYIYRINGSHGTLPEIEKTVMEIRRQVPRAEILIDLPGNKVRTANLLEPISLVKGEDFFLTKEQFSYPDFYKHIKVGDRVYANDNIFGFIVKEIKDNYVKFRSLSNGELLSSKGIHVRGLNKKLPFLFKKDQEIIDLVNRLKISFIGLSFVRTAADVRQVKKLIKSSTVISKVETRDAVKNLDEIMDEVDYLLIDRGDLAADVGLTRVPYFQKHVLGRAKTAGKNVILATQFLKTMESMPLPTIAEINDLANTIKEGVFAIQLSEETAVGKNPLKCLQYIKKMEREYGLGK